MSLKEYRRKRDFSVTPEPTASEQRSGLRRFVIQKHAASRLHYDFRLEIGGTLKSWALPKGLPFARGEKRLAVEVEDHPLSYRRFEGTIPKGAYGAGTVMVWDEGTFDTPTRSPSKDLNQGKLTVSLTGQKVQGTWHLVRLRGEDDQWLILRGGEGLEPPSSVRDDTSILSGRTMKQIAAGPGAKAPKSKSRDVSRLRLPRATPIPPMQALLVASPRSGGWTYEVKFDGYRVVVYKDGDQVQLLSRNGNSLDEHFPELVDAVRELGVRHVVLDGEIVALEASGRSSFQLLQRSIEQGQAAVHCYVFDLLEEDGESLLTYPIETRRGRLEALLADAPAVLRYSGPLGGPVASLLTRARAFGLEGLIGKRRGSVYEPGRRSGAWIKLKLVQEQEFVIGGFTPPSGGRTGFGALLIGVHEARKLVSVGKVGSGFDEATLRSLMSRMEALERSNSPFVDLPQPPAKRGTKRPPALGTPTLGRTALSGVRWVEPQLVCQVRFTEWTDGGRLRHPVFVGLREDKPAEAVIRERPRAPSERKA